MIAYLNKTSVAQQRNPETGRRIWRKNKWAQIAEELADYEYFGGDSDCHYNFWKIKEKVHPELKPPYYEHFCYCEHAIEKNCYVFNHDMQHFVVVGSCCINRFAKKRLCRSCQIPHSGKKYDQCPKCRKDEKRMKEDEIERRAEEERADLLRQRREERERKNKEAEAERQRQHEEAEAERQRQHLEYMRKEKEEKRRFNDVWTSGSVRDKLLTYQLPKLHILADNKGILKYQRYDREALIEVLLSYTTHRDLPIR